MRLLSSTRSPSTSHISPIPQQASAQAAQPPSPPTPSTASRASRRRSWHSDGVSPAAADVAEVAELAVEAGQLALGQAIVVGRVLDHLQLL